MLYLIASRWDFREAECFQSGASFEGGRALCMQKGDVSVLHLPRPFRPLPEVIEHLARLGHIEHAFVFAVGVIVGIDLAPIAVAQVDLLADFARNPRRK